MIKLKVLETAVITIAAIINIFLIAIPYLQVV